MTAPVQSEYVQPGVLQRHKAEIAETGSQVVGSVQTVDVVDVVNEYVNGV